MSWQNKISSLIEEKLQGHSLVEYGIELIDYERIYNGNSNLQYYASSEQGNFIVRISHSSKKLTNILQEEYILKKLSKVMCNIECPTIVTTVKGQKHSFIYTTEKYALQMFKYIEGEVKYNWWEVPLSSDIDLIVKSYKELNICLQQIRYTDYEENYLKYYYTTLELTKDKYWIYKQKISSTLTKNIDAFYINSKHILSNAESMLPQFKKQVVHEDIQLENILFRDSRISGIIDFEYARYGYEEFDVIFSAFRICKKGTSDIELNIDKNKLIYFIELYFGKANIIDFSDEKNYEFWLAFFSLQQSLLYMNNAIREQWILDVEIGFLPCFNTVLQYNLN